MKTPRTLGSWRCCPALFSRGNCLARRHWNSASYRAAAGKNPLGENYADPDMFTQRRRRGCHMELTGIEPVTSAVRLQRSPS